MKLLPFKKESNIKQAKQATLMVEEYNVERNKLIDECVKHLEEYVIACISEAARLHGETSVTITLDDVMNDFNSKHDKTSNNPKIINQDEYKVAVDRFVKYLEDEEFTYELLEGNRPIDPVFDGVEEKVSNLHITWPTPISSLNKTN